MRTLWLAVVAMSCASVTAVQAAETSPCADALTYLTQQYDADPATRAAFDAAYQGLQPLPHGYTYGHSSDNPWKKAGSGHGLMDAMRTFYDQVCTLLPQILGTNDNALDSIQYFAWLYYHNDAGVRLVTGIDPSDPKRPPLESVKTFLIMFNQLYKKHLDSPDSVGKVVEWAADPRLEMGDYESSDPAYYKSWNQFFARSLKFDAATKTYPSRPVTMPGRPYVVVSPTDCIMNPLVQVVQADPQNVQRKLIESPLQQDTTLDIKGIPISVTRLLGDAPAELKAKFTGGSGLACVLMPNTYHRFHAPVDGVIRYAAIARAGTNVAYGTFGYSDWPNWVPESGDVGRPGTDFSQFEGFQRGVIIIEISYPNLPGKQPETLTGYVASIPVGLDTVGSVVLADGVQAGARVTKGVTPLGNFFFGGSLNILLFSPIGGDPGQPQMVSPAVQTRMGTQIGILNLPYAPPKTPWTPD